MPAKLLVAMTVGSVQTWLREAVDSVLASEFKDFEFVVLFDGAPATMAKPNDSRIQWAEIPKLGRPKTLKMVLEKIGWEPPLLCWVDADDKVLPTAFGACVDKLDAMPSAGMAVTGFQRVNAAGQFIANVPPAPWLPGRLPVSPHLAVIRREVYNAAGGVDPNREMSFDTDLLTRCERECQAVAVIPKALYIYRRHGKSLGATRRHEQSRAAQKTRRDALKKDTPA